jgi:uncharacterized protein (DUF433 family)
MQQKLLDRIVIDPKIMVGKPVIKGTRIPVYVILNLLGDGYTFDDIIKDYPDLTRDDILEAVRFAAQFTEFEEVEA